MKLAYFSPMPPEQTGIADYSALLLPPLRERIDVDVVRRGTKRPPRGTDIALYHVGNNPDAHAWIVDALRREPGVVVLHDFVLHHLVSGMTLGRRDRDAYLDLMEREHGVAGRLLAYGVIDKRVPPLWEARPADFPLATFVLDHATGLVVHSQFVRDQARAAGYEGPICVVPHPAWPVPAVEPERVARGVVIGCFGVVNSSKRIPELLRSIAAATARAAGARAAPGRVDVSRLRPRSQAAAPRPGRRGVGSPRVGGRGEALVAHGRKRRPREPAASDDGRDVRQRRQGAVARQAARRQRRRLVLRASGRRRAEGST